VPLLFIERFDLFVCESKQVSLIRAPFVIRSILKKEHLFFVDEHLSKPSRELGALSSSIDRSLFQYAVSIHVGLFYEHSHSNTKCVPTPMIAFYYFC
jgi:hypothetical protein